MLIGLVWCFYRINYIDVEEPYYNYKYLFLLSADYDFFPTYSLLDMPRSLKKTNRYSNLHIVSMIKKLSFAFLMIDYLSNPLYL